MFLLVRVMHLHQTHVSHDIQLNAGVGNVSKRQQPGKKAKHSRIPIMGLQRGKKILHPKAGFSWPQNKIVFHAMLL